VSSLIAKIAVLNEPEVASLEGVKSMTLDVCLRFTAERTDY
jgi:hypothetical protein